MNTFLNRKCKPCEGGMPPMTSQEIEKSLAEMSDWVLDAGGSRIRASYVMKNFMEAVHLIGDIAGIAESEDHHPDIFLTGYRNLTVELTTHAINGLSENDFIVAAKIEALPKKLKEKKS